MSEQQNVQLVQSLYSAFLRGDTPAVLGMMADDVDFYIAGEGAFPTAGRRSGLAEMKNFFETLEESIQFESFEPRQYIAQGEMVVVLGAYVGIAKPTGRRFQCDWAMVWTMRDGKAAKFQEYTDTLAGAKAFQMDGAAAAV